LIIYFIFELKSTPYVVSVCKAEKMSEIDCDEVAILITAVLASKKPSVMTLNELESEYYETNGCRIPYKQMGHATLLKFLESMPQKVILQMYI
jgi:hypothetical protein